MMAQRYVQALDYSDWHAQNIFSKHAKKRPLGLIENKYNYTLAQPVFSVRPVDISLGGGRTYRPKSTTDIIAEQHNSIHKLFNKARNISSAPPKRITSAKTLTRKNNINIEVKGRPLTSVSRTELASKKSNHPSRPKTTGNLQCGKTPGLFMVVKVDPELLKSSQTQRDLTQQIHEQWGTKNHDLSGGTFVRGKKRPQTVPTRTDAWLTFGGTQGEASAGVVDAFASWRNSDQYYSIDGSVGSHVAQQLQRGDKIRIGINGVVQSHDLRIKSGKKADQEKESEQKESELKDNEQKDSEQKDTEFAFSFEDEQNNLFNRMSNLMEEETSQSRAPLSWNDQIQQTEVKILSPRVPCETMKPNMCETHPVIFEKLTGVSTPAHRTWATRTEGYKVKHRLKSEMFSSDKKDPRANRIKVISIDHRSQEEEEHLNNVSVEEVLRLTLDKRKGHHEEKSTPNKASKEKKHETVSSISVVKNSKANSHVSVNDFSGSGEQMTKPIQASVPRANDLSIVTPGARNRSLCEITPFRRTQAKPPKGHRVGFAGAGHPPHKIVSNETEYIKITSQIGNFKQISSSSYQQSNHLDHHSIGKVGGFAMDIPLMHSPFGPHPTFVAKDEDFSFMPEEEMGGGPPSPASSVSRSPPPSFQISIPTGDDASDGDSLLQSSPQRKASLAEDDEHDAVTGQQKREMATRDKQIDHITDLLVGSLIDGDSVQTHVMKDDNIVDNDSER